VDRFVIDDEDSAFVFHCIGICNNQALAMASYGDNVALQGLYLRRLLHGIDLPDESDLQRFRSILKKFVVEGLALASAIQALSEHHVGGHTILFSDVEERLAKRNAAGRELCHLFSRIVPAYGEEPIAAAEIEEAVGVEGLKVEGHLVSLTRAEVDLQLGNGLSVGRWLLPILQGEE
jgi:hypothetical protein